MSNPIKFLQNHNIPTASAVQSIKHLNHHSDEYDFKSLLNGMTNTTQDLSARDTKYVFMYAVQEILNLSTTTDIYDMETIISTAKTKAAKFIKNNPWTFAGEEKSSSLSSPVDTSGKPKRKKGAKQTAALEIYGRLKDTKTKQEIIQIFIDDLDMSKSGATTYFYNVKKKLGA